MHYTEKLEEQPKTIEVEGLTKSFGNVTAVNDISFSVIRGEIFGFLGPNGAGKTTTINILTGLVRPDGGKILIAEIDCTGRPKAAQHLIGVVPDESNLYPELTGFQNLCFCAALYGMRKAERQARALELLNTFGLAEAAERTFAGYSKGMKRKLTIAAGIIHNPPILFLDEPTTGVDVASARHIRRMIADLHRAGTTIFLTTHYIEEAERLCRRIAFIVSGRIVRTDVVEELMRHIEGRHVVEFTLDGATIDLTGELSSAFSQFEVEAVAKDRLRVKSSHPVRVGPLVRFFEDHGLEVAEARKVRPSLEEIFVRVTGIEAAAMKQEKEKVGSSV